MELPKFGLEARSVAIPSSLRGASERFSIYFVPAIVSLIVLILLFGVVRTRIGAIFQLRSQIAQSQQKLKVLDGKLLALKSFNRDQILQDTRKAEISLPSEKDLPTLLSNLERIAGETGVGITAIQLTPGQLVPETGKGEAESFPVKMTISGNFFQLKSFLGNVFVSPRVMIVKTLTVASGQQQASLSATLGLESFFQTLAKTQFTVEEPLQSLTPEEQQILAKITIPAQVAISPLPVLPTGRPDPFAPF